MSKKIDYSEFEEACKVEHKSSVLRDMWHAIRKDDRPHWEIMADDSMNKTLKFALFCVFAYGFYQVIVELVDKFI